MSGSGSTIFCLGEPGSGADIFEAAVRRAAVPGRCGRHWESPWEKSFKHHRFSENVDDLELVSKSSKDHRFSENVDD